MERILFLESPLLRHLKCGEQKQLEKRDAELKLLEQQYNEAVCVIGWLMGVEASAANVVGLPVFWEE
jgi:hypothetical protein